jgi:exonuclease VII small subunit
MPWENLEQAFYVKKECMQALEGAEMEIIRWLEEI